MSSSPSTPARRAKFDGVQVTGNTGRTLDQIVHATGWRTIFGVRGWKQLTEARLDDGVDGVRASYQKHNRLLAKVTLTGLDVSRGHQHCDPVAEH